MSVENVLDEEKIVFRIYGNSTEKIIDRFVSFVAAFNSKTTSEKLKLEILNF